jgi:cullin 1
MKARKTMKNQPLIQEIISQISQRLNPKIPDIKTVCFGLPPLLKAQNSLHCWTQALDTLLEKEYIERVDGTRDSFAYVA